MTAKGQAMSDCGGGPCHDTLDLNRLRSGDYRALNPDNQGLFDEIATTREALRVADRLLGKTLKYLATSSGVGSNGLRAEVLKHLEATEGGE